MHTVFISFTVHFIEFHSLPKIAKSTPFTHHKERFRARFDSIS